MPAKTRNRGYDGSIKNNSKYKDNVKVTAIRKCYQSALLNQSIN